MPKNTFVIRFFFLKNPLQMRTSYVQLQTCYWVPTLYQVLDNSPSSYQLVLSRNVSLLAVEQKAIACLFLKSPSIQAKIGKNYSIVIILLC